MTVISTHECKKKNRGINSHFMICVATHKLEMDYLKKNRRRCLEVVEKKKEIIRNNLENSCKNTKQIFKDFVCKTLEKKKGLNSLVWGFEV